MGFAPRTADFGAGLQADMQVAAAIALCRRQTQAFEAQRLFAAQDVDFARAMRRSDDSAPAGQ